VLPEDRNGGNNDTGRRKNKLLWGEWPGHRRVIDGVVTKLRACDKSRGIAAGWVLCSFG
jgi:hypothetical protein